jgi:transposase InsO family protein
MKAREEMPLLRCALGPYGPPLRGRAALRNGIRNRWPQGHHNTELGHGRFHLKKADPWSKNGGRRNVWAQDIPISMDGRGRALDNAFIERLWWTVKYENVYPKDYADGHELYRGLENYFEYYNNDRKHSKLDNVTPAEVFLGVQERDES